MACIAFLVLDEQSCFVHPTIFYRYPDLGFSPNLISFTPTFVFFSPHFLPKPKPFSRSSGLSFGVGGTSSSLPRRFDRGPPSLSSLGNSARRGVSAVTTFLADLRMFSRTFHSRFFAMKNRAAEATGLAIQG